MKKALFAAVLAVMAQGAYAVEFADLQALKAANIEMAAAVKAEIPVSEPAPQLSSELPGRYTVNIFAKEILTGAVVLEGKNLPVIITYRTFPEDSKITVGLLLFEISEYGISFSGYRKADGVDQNIEILPVPEEILKNPQQAAKEFGIANYKEIKCAKGDYLLMLSDNISGKITGNCVLLR